jgi:hypothetical protein
LNSRPLDVDVLWLLSFKTTESEKKIDINAICGLKGREFNSSFGSFCSLLFGQQAGRENSVLRA